MIYPDLHPSLEIPGLPDDLRERLRTRMEELFGSHSDRSRLPSLYSITQAINEPQYLQRLTGTDDEEKRREIMNQQLLRRLELLVAVLRYQASSESWLERYRALAVEVRELKQLISDLPSDHPLVGLTLSMAGLVQNYCNIDPDDIFSELDGVKGLTADRVYESLLIVFNDLKAGGSTFAESNRYRFSALSGCQAFAIPNAEGATANLIEALRDGSLVYRSFVEPKRQFHEAKANLNRPQFAARLEEALRGPVDGRRFTPFEEVEKQQEAAEASFYAAIEHLKLWYARLVAARDRLAAALPAALAALNPGDNIWSMKEAFGEGNEIAVYRAMINCIAATALLEQMNDFEAEFRKIEPEFEDTNVDPSDFIEKALAQVA